MWRLNINIKKQMSFVSNGGKFKFYTVLNGLLFPTPTQSRISFERVMYRILEWFDAHRKNSFNFVGIVEPEI
jgi:hypothetical protein